MTTKTSGDAGDTGNLRRADGKSPLTVVGIGASAGGVPALINFFSHAPASMDMAFVVILHLSPEHESHADAILQRATAMPVAQVSDVTRIERNHVYVIAPGKQLRLSDGHLHVTDRNEPDRRILTIDEFFRTLADAQGMNAMGIVLSGTGSDGAVGLSRIKENGGVTMAQDPNDAEYPEMPQHAITTGQVDIILPAAEMPQKLLELRDTARRIRVPALETVEQEVEEPGPPRGGAERALQDVLMHLRVRTGHDFRHYKRATVLRRIERRLQVNGLTDLESYRNYLRATPDETAALLADMLIGVTQFFRDRDAFDALRHAVIPGLFRSATSDAQIRVWVAGCSTGEEAYSIAMMMMQAREAAGSASAMQVFATDIDDAAVMRARAGSYPDSIAADVPGDLLRRYFLQEGARYTIVKPVRERILFASHSLLRDPPFSHLDLISCRNVLIYLDRGVQRQILELFHFALRPDGYLFLGSAESADAADDLFAVVDKQYRIYRARKIVNGARQASAFPSLAQTGGVPEDVQSIAASANPPLPPERRNFSFSALHQRVLEEYAPPSVIVDRDSTIVHLSDNAGKFLHHAGGEPSTNIMAVVVPELRLDLRTTLFRALQTGASVEARRVKLVRDGRTSWINMTVRPFHDPGVNADFFLVLFDEVQERMSEEGEAGHKGQDPVLMQLEQELQHSREQLATNIEQYETSVEELKASNEELQAINEELRSATEELESSKEELQSVNEELTTLNSELHSRVEETAKANDDLQNIIVSTEIATVFVDRKIQVKRFTPSATRIFKLIDSDIGRSLFDVTHSLKHPTLAEDVKEAFETLKLIERELQSQEGQWYLMRLLPYRTADDRIDGAVLTLIDITARHEAEELARIGEQRLRLVAQSTNDYAIIVQDTAGRIVSWNTGAERIFGYAESEVTGKDIALIYEQDDRQAQIPARERETAGNEGRADDERWHVTKDHRRVWCSGVVTPIADASFTGFAKIVRDLTERKQRDDAKEVALLHEQEERQRETQSNQMKDDFIAVLSHELKHPLNLIGMKAEMLARLPQTRDIEAVRDTADAIRRAVRGQAQIIDDLLDLSRVRTGKLALDQGALDIASVVRDIAKVCEQDTIARSIKLSVTGATQSATIYADRTRCEQILWNLVSNAIKFTGPGGTIELRISREHKMIRIDVIDTGEGIATSELPHVFDMYRQGIRGRSKAGLGIGLALVRQLAEMHGGRVDAYSDGPGQGSTLSVWLPAMGEFGKLEPAPPSPGSLAGVRTMIALEEPETASSLARLLELEGASVTTAVGIGQAKTVMSTQPVDIVICEVHDSGSDARAFIAGLKSDPGLQRIRTVAVTGSDRDADRRAVLDAGFDAQISRPIDFQVLIQALQRILPALRK
ncbi:CheR family methyltransferase [Paraburkholderia lycopersici]|uniref:Two-component system, chemotaxis family, CheB/CheR fusion protein n=1 Tax=Paraburkholderia lycopersici TaxID=416944 RepID=A0A1G6TGJ6_9BURK|nr:CheR family methyltransferase [Paraburkholderia lycopersici]SDD27636.1 two-component system, chemotaxis family, CheB/CheR fusion protein [Paraburkholderia lycopersici]